MPTFQLVAVGGRALHFQGAGGSPNLPLSSKQPTRIGRAPDNDVRLPADWVQISSRHCVVTYSPEQDSWLVRDLSTNGTFVNDARVGKGGQAVARVGDRLRLSVADPKAPDNHLEYVLRRFDSSPEAATSAAQPTHGALAAAPPAHTPKRKLSEGGGEGTVGATASKRARGATPGTAGPPAGGGVTPAANGDAAGAAAADNRPAAGADVSLDAMFRLGEHNKELVRQLDAERARHEQTERRLRAEAEAARGDAAAARAEAQDQVRAAKERAREVEAELTALRSRGMQLQMDIEAERAAAGRAGEEAAAAHEACAAAETARAAAEGRLAALEEQLVAAGQEAERGMADASAARAEADALRAALAAERQEKAGVAASLGAALAEAQQARDQAAQLEARVGQERRAREAAQRAAEEERVRLEEALRKIGTLESRERLLQNDRLLVAGCLAELQRGSDRSQAANQRISEAFARLQEAKREADAIMEAQRQQCTDICAKLAASNASRVLQPSPAPATLANTQDALGMLSPAGMPLTAPTAAVVATTPLAHAGVQGGQLRLAGEDVMGVQVEEGPAAEPEQQRQHADDEMEEAEEDGGPAAAHAGAAPTPASEGGGEQGSGAASTPAPAPASGTAVGGEEAELAAAGSQEQEPAAEATVAVAAAADAGAAAAARWAEMALAGTELMDFGGALGGAGPAQVQEAAEAAIEAAAARSGSSDGGGGDDGSVSEDEEPAAAQELAAQRAEAQPDADAEHAGAEYSGSTAPQSSECAQYDEAGEEGESEALDGEAKGQVQQLAAAQEGAPAAEQAGAEDAPAPAAGELPPEGRTAADPQFEADALGHEMHVEQEQREAAEDQEPAVELEEPDVVVQEGDEAEEAEEAAGAEEPENDASQGNLAGTQEDRSLPSKIPESDPQQQSSGAAAGPGAGWL